MKLSRSLLTLMLLMSFLCHGQKWVAIGHVHAFKNLPLKDISITTKKTRSTVFSDSLGNFKVECVGKDRLTFKGSGFKKASKTVKENEFIEVKMLFLEGQKHEEMAVGYGHVSKENLTNSIAHYSNYNSDFSGYADVFAIIQGKFSGVKILDNGSVKKVVMRGTSTFNLDNAALYVVDDQIMEDISFLSPVNIKSIDVMKEGSIYGSRGANGVVVITTER